MSSSSPAQIWSAGDFRPIGAWTTLIGELLCEAVDLSAGDRVLDIATGTGNSALAAARRMCTVTAVDCTPKLLAHARKRARVEGLEVNFRRACAERLPFHDGAFDTVLTTFGATFANDVTAAIGEAARVCRSDGRIGMTTWTNNGLIGRILDVLRRHDTHPPPRVDWGHEESVRESLSRYARSIRIARRAFCFRYMSPTGWLAFMKLHYGPMAAVFASPASSQAALDSELLEAICASNCSSDGKLTAPAEYLEIVAVRS
jgi:ubiquinone/menaquinone biosynthesis C-methylase UbiE